MVQTTYSEKYTPSRKTTCLFVLVRVYHYRMTTTHVLVPCYVHKKRIYHLKHYLHLPLVWSTMTLLLTNNVLLSVAIRVFNYPVLCRKWAYRIAMNELSQSLLGLSGAYRSNALLPFRMINISQSWFRGYQSYYLYSIFFLLGLICHGKS